MLIEEHMTVSLGHFDGPTEHCTDISEAMQQAGIATDGETKNALGSVLKMAVLSDGEITPVQRSKRNADVADVDSFEKAARRVAIKNLEEPQGNPDVHSFCSFSNTHIEENLGGVGLSLGSNEN
jgi:hypothetical protein